MPSVQITEISSADQAIALPYAPGITAIDAASWAQHQPFNHFAISRDDHCVGRCSVWKTNTPRLNDLPVGIIGHYAATDIEAGTAFLNHAAKFLTIGGLCTIAGPMDGNTWRRYRLVTDRGTEPPFFLEPDNPGDWPGHFLAAGFTPLAHYSSTLNGDLPVRDPRTPEALSRFHADGVRIRKMNLADYEQELRSIHELSTQAFAGNFLYTPISLEEFTAMYGPLQCMLQSELVLLAERDDQLLGFIFGLPDLLEIKRGVKSKTAIAKSMAVRPGRSGAGLGSILIDEFQQAARSLGYSRVIHALMHESNRSKKITSRFGKPIREYTLFSKVSDVLPLPVSKSQASV